MIFGAQIGYNFPQTISNKQNHIKYGNISAKGSYNILHINKGNSNFENKLDDLYILLEIHKPDIVSIQEANYDIYSKIKIRGYSVEYNTLTINYNIARTILLIREGINYKRKNNFEDTYISSIWLEIFIKK